MKNTANPKTKPASPSAYPTRSITLLARQMQRVSPAMVKVIEGECDGVLILKNAKGAGLIAKEIHFREIAEITGDTIAETKPA